MNRAFDAMQYAIEKANRDHRRKVASIEFWHRFRMAMLWLAVAGFFVGHLIVWARQGFSVTPY